MPGLSLKIGAEIDAAVAGAKKVEKSLIDLQTTASRPIEIKFKSLAELQAQLQRFKEALSGDMGVESFNRLNRAIDVTKDRIKNFKITPIVPENVVIPPPDGSRFTKTLAELQAQLQRFKDSFRDEMGVESFNRLNRAIEATKAKIENFKAPEIIIPAGGFAKTLRELQAQLKRFQEGIKDATNPESFARLDRAIIATKDRIKNFRVAPITIPPVVIPAPDGSRVTKTLLDLQAQLKRFQAALLLATNPESFNRLNRAIEATNARMRALGGSVPVNPLKNLSGTSNQATQSMINLGRVVQDAPFGFLGIANNLNPLLESFQRLKQSTGSTGGAIKALGASLMGAGGLGFALSIVSSLLIVFGDRLFGTGRAFSNAALGAEKFKILLNQLGEASDKLKKKLDFGATIKNLLFEITNGQEGLDKFKLETDIGVNDEVIKDAGETIKKLNPILTQATAKMNGYVKELEAFEKTTGETSKLLNLIRIFKGIKNIPESFTEKLPEVDRTTIQGFKDLQKEIDKATETQNDALQKNLENRGKITLLAANKAREAAKKEIEGMKGQNSEVQDLLKARLEIIDDFVFRFSEAKIQFPEIDFSKLPPNLKRGNEVLRSGLAELLKTRIEAFEKLKAPAELNIDFDVQVNKASVDLLRAQIKFIEDEFRVKPPVISFQIQPMGTAASTIKKEIEAAAAAAKKLLQDRVAELNNIIATGIEGAAIAIGEGIAVAISGGGVKDIFKGLFESLGTAMQSFGKALITQAIAITALKRVLTNPGVAIAAGVALIAAGAAIKASISKIQGFAQGGLVFGPTLAMVGEGGGTSRSNPEVVAPLDQLKNIIGGGANQVQVFGEFELRGNNLIAAITRNQQSQRRLG